MCCHMMLELSLCSVLATNFALRPLWPCISFFLCHVNAAEFQFMICFIIYIWLELGPYQFNNIRLFADYIFCCAMLSKICQQYPLSVFKRFIFCGRWLSVTVMHPDKRLPAIIILWQLAIVSLLNFFLRSQTRVHQDLSQVFFFKLDHEYQKLIMQRLTLQYLL